MLVRTLTPADSLDLPRVLAHCLLSTYARFIPKDILSRLPFASRVADWVADLYNSPEALSFIAEDGAEIVGCAAGRPDAETGMGELEAIYLLPGARSQGLGERLFRSVAHGLAECGFDGMKLWTLSENAPARRFYERLGGTVGTERSFALGPARLREIEYRWANLAATLRPSPPTVAGVFAGPPMLARALAV